MIAIPNMDKPKSCTECPFEVIGISGYPRCVIVQEMVVDGNLFNRCPLIDIDENDPVLLEFLNEFDKWRAYKELMDSIRTAQKKGEANERIHM